MSELLDVKDIMQRGSPLAGYSNYSKGLPGTNKRHVGPQPLAKRVRSTRAREARRARRAIVHYGRLVLS